MREPKLTTEEEERRAELLAYGADPRWIDRSPSYAVGHARNRYDDPHPHVMMKSAPILPAMPNMLAPDPEGEATTAAALKAMMGTDFRDDARTKAVGAAVRAVTAAALLLVTATMLWGVAWLYADVAAFWLVAAWLVALVATVFYYLTSERMDRRFSAAGVEHKKIDAATQMHYDRLEARKEMHQAAVNAWENVMLKGLDRWQGGNE